MRSIPILCAASLLFATVPHGSAAGSARRPNIILITLDTTRPDAIGSYGARVGGQSPTPSIDAIAARGTLYARAFAPTPLTLPSHASLLTGLDPPAHGVHENGTEALPASIPTLAAVLKQRGYATAAFVSSRVLDRRFGLARGFEVYDDGIPAEQIGEPGFTERFAGQVTSAVVSMLRGRKDARPMFLWVHYYDAHAPYQPPPPFGGGNDRERYQGELRFVDSEIGKLLTALAPRPEDIIAIVADHGESLGEHGEPTHGLFIYGSTLHVPMIVAGGRVAAGSVVDEPVGTVRLPGTLLELARVEKPASMAPVLPGVGLTDASSFKGMFSETRFPASAYGWSPIKGFSDGRWRAIFAPKPELFDSSADPGETRNIIDTNRREFFRLQRAMKQHEESMPQSRAAQASTDPEIAAALRSLGYATGAAGTEGTLDPKDGLTLLVEAERAAELIRAGRAASAIEIMTTLVARNPTNVLFVTTLADAEKASGASDKALVSYRRAVALNPQLDFLHLNLANALRESGRLKDAEAEYRLALRLHPRMAAASIWLAEMYLGRGARDAARQELQRSITAGTRSASIYTRLARMNFDDGNAGAAETSARAAIEVAERWPAAWVVLGDAQQKKGDLRGARRSYEHAVEIDFRNAGAHLRLGKLLRQLGDEAGARRALNRIVEVAPRSAEATEARRLLSGGS